MADTTCFCGARFDTVATLDQHAVQRGHRVRCDCGKLFKTPENVFNHQVKVHKTGIGWHLHPSLEDHGLGSTTTVVPSGKLGCDLCGRSFKDTKALEDHNADKHQHPTPPGKLSCNFCNKKYKDDQALKAHKADKHPSCPVCNESFVEPGRLVVHKKGTGHCFCDEHDIVFKTLVEFKAHQNDGKHVTGFECLDCSRSFGTQQGLDDHLQTEAHAGIAVAALARANEAQTAATAATLAAAQEEANLRCEECKQNFKKIGHFKQHKASLRHNKLSDLPCPLSDQCNKTFTSPSSLLHHLESGKCKSLMNRKKLDAMVHMHDTHRHITHQKNVVNVLSAASATGSLPAASDMAAVRRSLSSAGVIFTPEASSTITDDGFDSEGPITEIPDLASDIESLSLTDRKAVGLTPDATIFGISSGMSHLKLTPAEDHNTGGFGPRIEEVDDDETTGSTNGGVPIFTPTTRSRASSTAGSSSGGVPIYTPSHSRSSSLAGGVPLSLTSSQAGEWPMTNTYQTKPPGTSSYDTIEFDELAQNWPCTFPGCDKTFRKKEDLLAHLDSPTHAPELYHCPTGLEAFGTTRKMKGFKTLSGFAQHIEAGACAGGKEALKHIAGLFEAQIAKVTGKQVKLLKVGAAGA